MMVSAVAAITERNVHIPSGSLPLIILHWRDEHYQNAFSPLDMRKSFEQKLRDGLFAEDVVREWIKQAESWAFMKDLKEEDAVARLLGEYFQIHIAS